MIKTRAIRLRGKEGRDKIALCAFHSFLLEVPFLVVVLFSGEKKVLTPTSHRISLGPGSAMGKNVKNEMKRHDYR